MKQQQTSNLSLLKHSEAAASSRKAKKEIEMFGAYHHESKSSFTKLAKLIDIPKCIDEINTHRLAE